MSEPRSLEAFAGEAEHLDPYAERILAAARALLVEHGLRRTTLSDVARAAHRRAHPGGLPSVSSPRAHPWFTVDENPKGATVSIFELG
jgi:nicotinic acid phosphoribosyltransferase